MNTVLNAFNICKGSFFLPYYWMLGCSQFNIVTFHTWTTHIYIFKGCNFNFELHFFAVWAPKRFLMIYLLKCTPLYLSLLLNIFSFFSKNMFYLCEFLFHINKNVTVILIVREQRHLIQLQWMKWVFKHVKLEHLCRKITKKKQIILSLIL